MVDYKHPGKETDEHYCDPYGVLAWAVGSEDDFICFDYGIADDGTWHLASTLETDSFIQAFDKEFACFPEEVIENAIGMIDRALDWCSDNQVELDIDGWNQDPWYFARIVKWELEETGEMPHRITRCSCGKFKKAPYRVKGHLRAPCTSCARNARPE